MSSNDAKPRIGLCLSGGGITGAMFEVGCLAALEDYFQRFRASDFDVIVGASSGATVATALAGGLSAQRMYRALLDPADDFFPLQRHHLLGLDLIELRRVWASSLGALRRVLMSASSKPLRLDVWTELDRFYDSLPAGMFSMEAYERFISDFMRRRGIPDRFGDMPKALRLVALDLDGGQRVAFGGEDAPDVPVQKAVAAASAVPVLYAPVRIDRRDYVALGMGHAGHADVAAQLGCRVVLMVNAMVPVLTNPASREVPTGHGPMTRVRDKGLLWVYSQTLRLMSEARLQEGLSHYRREHPELEVLLLQPERSDATMFMYSPTNFAARRVILEYGYTSTLRALRAEGSTMAHRLREHGLV